MDTYTSHLAAEAGVKALAHFIESHGGKPSSAIGIFSPGSETCFRCFGDLRKCVSTCETQYFVKRGVCENRQTRRIRF